MKAARNVGEAGQVAAEYLVVAVGVLLALGVLGALARKTCVDAREASASGSQDRGDCRSIDQVVDQALQKSVEDVTFLINLPS